MSQPERLSVRWNEVVPAACDHRTGGELQHAIRQRIAMVVIEEPPAVHSFFPQSSLNFFQSHIDIRRQSTRVWKLASPATSRASITENEITSSSQSWL